MADEPALIAEDVAAQVKEAEQRQSDPHEFSPAEEHEFCSWCAAPEDASCHEQSDGSMCEEL